MSQKTLMESRYFLDPLLISVNKLLLLYITYIHHHIYDMYRIAAEDRSLVDNDGKHEHHIHDIIYAPLRTPPPHTCSGGKRWGLDGCNGERDFGFLQCTSRRPWRS